MKIIVTSDLHGYLPVIKENFDILLICGDICPVWEHNRQFQSEWIRGDFAEWVNNLPFKDENSRVIMIAGNHDFIFEDMKEGKKNSWLKKFKDDRLIYLRNESTVCQGLKIFGCPYCKIFGRWAFMREYLDKYYTAIPTDLDILITHDAADLNNLGMINEGRQAGINAGNSILSEYVLKRHPKYYFCGHIHSGNHELKEVNGTKMANVSYINENYDIAYEPLVLEIEKSEE